MLLTQNLRPFGIVLIAGAGCLLLAEPARILAGPGTDPDVRPAGVALQPTSVANQVKLAEDYLSGRGVEQDTKKAAYWYERAAGAGDPEAQFEIGYLYATGTGVDKNPERAAHWYQLAASNQLPLAKVSLAVAYLWGTGVKKNEGLAFELLNEAAKEGSGLAACYLGDFYAFGIGVPRDRSKAEQWYRKGASLHDPIAEYDLALTIMDDNAAQELPNSARLFRNSAAAGYVPAKHQLGLLLVRNPGLATSPQEPVELLSEAADAGNWRSSVLLGVLARDGIGIPVDLAAACYHFRVAELQGGADASKLVAHDLELLSARLGQDYVRDIDLKAEEWIKAHPSAFTFVDNDGGSVRGFTVATADSSHVARILLTPTR